jgi:hypothetical protein
MLNMQGNSINIWLLGTIDYKVVNIILKSKIITMIVKLL